MILSRNSFKVSRSNITFTSPVLKPSLPLHSPDRTTPLHTAVSSLSSQSQRLRKFQSVSFARLCQILLAGLGPSENGRILRRLRKAVDWVLHRARQQLKSRPTTRICEEETKILFYNGSG